VRAKAWLLLKARNKTNGRLIQEGERMTRTPERFRVTLRETPFLLNGSGAPAPLPLARFAGRRRGLRESRSGVPNRGSDR